MIPRVGLSFYCSEYADLPIVLTGGTLHCPSWVMNDPIIRGQSRGQPHLDPLSVISHAWMTPLSAGSHVMVPGCQASSPTVRTILLALDMTKWFIWAFIWQAFHEISILIKIYFTRISLFVRCSFPRIILIKPSCLA